MKSPIFEIAAGALICLSITSVAIASNEGDNDIYKLYRISSFGDIHIATFDVRGEHVSYNRKNCLLVAQFFKETNLANNSSFRCKKQSK